MLRDIGDKNTMAAMLRDSLLITPMLSRHVLAPVDKNTINTHYMQLMWICFTPTAQVGQMGLFSASSSTNHTHRHVVAPSDNKIK
jgi:hypothetical protein